MNITLAKSAGFCFGVKRALDMVYELRSQKDGCIYTLGEIIHNEVVVEELRAKNIIPINEEDLESTRPGPIVIRSHGIAKKTEDRLKELGFSINDATCVFVKNIHKAVHQHSLSGAHVIVFGNPEHAEVKGIVGWIVSEEYTVLRDKREAGKFSLNKTKPIFVVAQTTFNHKLFKECVEILIEKGYYVNTLDSICSATYERQLEAEQIASKVDAMIVIGGRHSSNTNKLYDICRSKCDNTFFLQTKADLDPTVLQSIDNVGITAGASTPDKIIREVMMECQK